MGWNSFRSASRGSTGNNVYESQHNQDDRPGISEIGERCATCRFYTWGDQQGYLHGYCRAYMTFTDEMGVCKSYQPCPACLYR